MSQDFSELLGSGLIKNDRQKINNNFLAVASDFSGTAFPTNNLVDGMTCYRTDQNKIYRYINGSWVVDTDLSIVDKIVITDDKATQAEAEAGTNDTKYITPLMLVKALLANIASQVEAEAGTANNKLMTPLAVKQSVTKNAPAPIIATQTEAEAGTNNTKMMTPLRAMQTAKKAIEAFSAGELLTILAAYAKLASPTFTGTPKAPTAASSTNNTQLATTAFVHSVAVAANTGGIIAASLAANGYVKFANGLIIQWGNFAPADGDFSISFPISFSTACYSVAEGAYATSDVNLQIHAIAINSFNGWTKSCSRCWYIAIGK